MKPRKQYKARNVKHNGKGTPEYCVWQAMKQRCYSPTNPGYLNYGGRGIQICDRWRTDFATFKADMGPRPKNTSIERLDNNGNYCPENCVWATREVQSRNRRTSVYITFKGKTQTLVDWAKEQDLSHSLISHRLKIGWTTEEALTTRPNTRRITHRLLTYNGQTKPLSIWAKEVNVSPSAIRARLAQGQSVADALSTPSRNRVRNGQQISNKAGVSSGRR